MTLTEVEKQRIEAEEIFRHEIQVTLAKSKAATTPIWSLLNSPFVLWVLSSIVLSIFAWGFKALNASIETTRQNAELIRTLDIEISFRIEEARLARRHERR